MTPHGFQASKAWSGYADHGNKSCFSMNGFVFSFFSQFYQDPGHGSRYLKESLAISHPPLIWDFFPAHVSFHLHSTNGLHQDFSWALDPILDFIPSTSHLTNLLGKVRMWTWIKPVVKGTTHLLDRYLVSTLELCTYTTWTFLHTKWNRITTLWALHKES